MSNTKRTKSAEAYLARRYASEERLETKAVALGYTSALDYATTLVLAQWPATRDPEAVAKRVIRRAIESNDSIGRVVAIGAF